MSENQGFGINELEVGQSAEIERQVDDNLIAKFAEVSGDFNPLHMSDEFAAKTIFGKRIAHGALTASYISGILGNNLPGPGAIFIGLSMRFKRPVHIGDEVTVRAEVSEKKERGNRVTLKVDCTVDGKRVITGEAEVVAPRRGD